MGDVEVMRMIKSAIVFVLISIFIAGCSSTKETAPSNNIKHYVISGRIEKDRSISTQYFIDGSLKESKGQFAEAILDYQDALRYDQDAAIYFAIAKNYAQLKRFAAATENAQEAVKRDSNNID